MDEAANTALKTYCAAMSDRKESADRNKLVNAQMESAKAIILSYMLASNTKCIPAGENNFIILKKKSSKPSLNSEFLSVLFNAFAKERKISGLTEVDGENFAKFCTTHQNRLATTEWDVASSKTRPVSTLF